MPKFIDLLQKRWSQNGRLLCVGLDPSIDRLPCVFSKNKTSFLDFSREIVDATAEYVCAFKPQIAYYAAYGAEAQLESTIAYIKTNYPDIPVILDAKRGDIGDTAKMYAKEAFERYAADAVTVNPYMGRDTVEPYLEYHDKGTIILCRTSNAGSGELQALTSEGQSIAQRVAQMAVELSAVNSNISLVIGATYPQELKQIRDVVGDMTLLVPGVGTQGGSLQDVMQNGLNQHKGGLVINSSRAVIYAGNGPDFAQKAAEVCAYYQKQMTEVLRKSV